MTFTELAKLDRETKKPTKAPPKSSGKAKKPVEANVPNHSPTPPKKALLEAKEATPKEEGIVGDTMKPRRHDTKVSPYKASLIEIVRKAVKDFGKEAATYRFTQEEKKILADIVYQYKGQGTKTSENQLTRIAVNFLAEDYKENGANSILARVIERLNA